MHSGFQELQPLLEIAGLMFQHPQKMAGPGVARVAGKNGPIELPRLG